jgi:hypothetical protein
LGDAGVYLGRLLLACVAETSLNLGSSISIAIVATVRVVVICEDAPHSVKTMATGHAEVIKLAAFTEKWPKVHTNQTLRTVAEGISMCGGVLFDVESDLG